MAASVDAPVRPVPPVSTSLTPCAVTMVPNTVTLVTRPRRAPKVANDATAVRPKRLFAKTQKKKRRKIKIVARNCKFTVAQQLCMYRKFHVLLSSASYRPIPTDRPQATGSSTSIFALPLSSLVRGLALQRKKGRVLNNSCASTQLGPVPHAAQGHFPSTNQKGINYFVQSHHFTQFFHQPCK